MIGNYERKIVLLDDEDISRVLTGLHLLKSRYNQELNTGEVEETESLFNKIDECDEMGVIRYEKN